MAIVGFVGLGNMGAVLAANLVAAGHDVVAHDIAGPARCPAGATFTGDLAAIAAAPTVVLSLPDSAASGSVAASLAATPARQVRHLVDTSTVGLAAARVNAARLAAAGIAYVDAAVSGGVAGARARTLAVMYAAPPDACAAVVPVLEGLSDRRFRVGDDPGMAQAVKLANNFLSATALAATSEAVAFATAAGVDMATLLDVLNASSGRSAASEDKFVHHVLTGTYAAGFANTLMAKDVRLYLDAVGAQATASAIGEVTSDIWRRFAEARPGADFTAVYDFTNTSEPTGRDSHG
jgi:3-hydroxyisobutyrate dehydrogenase-like beta-hydroxyacid dehydrogenase